MYSAPCREAGCCDEHVCLLVCLFVCPVVTPGKIKYQVIRRSVKNTGSLDRYTSNYKTDDICRAVVRAPGAIIEFGYEKVDFLYEKNNFHALSLSRWANGSLQCGK